MDVLIGKATSLDLPLAPAAFSNRMEYVRLLLGAGADPGTRTGGITPLEYAIYLGNTQVVDLLAEHGIVPQALWTYAGLPCPTPDPGDIRSGGIMAEAFVHACQHGRTEVVRWFLDRGLNPDVAPYLGRTGLHWAIMHSQLEVVLCRPARGRQAARCAGAPRLRAPRRAARPGGGAAPPG